jgi:hypothetical protein
MGYHDAAEDHGGMLRLKDIEHNFGKNVARMVEGLSDSLTDDPGNKQPWQTRKESYIGFNYNYRCIKRRQIAGNKAAKFSDLSAARQRASGHQRAETGKNVTRKKRDRRNVP